MRQRTPRRPTPARQRPGRSRVPGPLPRGSCRRRHRRPLAPLPAPADGPRLLSLHRACETRRACRRCLTAAWASRSSLVRLVGGQAGCVRVLTLRNKALALCPARLVDLGVHTSPVLASARHGRPRDLGPPRIPNWSYRVPVPPWRVRLCQLRIPTCEVIRMLQGVRALSLCPPRGVRLACGAALSL